MTGGLCQQPPTLWDGVSQVTLKTGLKYDDGMDFQTSFDFVANYTDSLALFVFSKSSFASPLCTARDVQPPTLYSYVQPSTRLQRSWRFKTQQQQLRFKLSLFWELIEIVSLENNNAENWVFLLKEYFLFSTEKRQCTKSHRIQVLNAAAVNLGNYFHVLLTLSPQGHALHPSQPHIRCLPGVGCVPLPQGSH